MRGENTREKNTFVVDTSFVLAFLLPDEKHQNVEALFLKFERNEIDFVAPELLIYETLNGLRSAVLQKRQSERIAALLLDSFLNMGIILEKIDEREVLRLALKKNISAYDASYVWLALSKKIKLLSLDERLVNLTK